MPKSILEDINKLLSEVDAADAARKQAQANLLAEFDEAVKELKQRQQNAENAVAAHKATVQAAINAEIKKAERVYEHEVRAREQEVASRLADLDRMRGTIRKVESELPADAQSIQPSSVDERGSIFSYPEYDSLCAEIVQATNEGQTFVASLRRLFGNNAANEARIAAIAKIKGMIAHDQALIDCWEKEARQRLNASDLRQQFLDEKRRIEEARRTDDQLGVKQENYEQLKREIEGRYKSESERIANAPMGKSHDTAIQECRDLAMNETERLGCSPSQLKAPYDPPALVPIDIFAFWYVVESRGKGLIVPQAISMSNPVHLTFDLADDSHAAVEAIRSMTALQIKQMPYNGISIYWLDPTNMGRTLGRLASLASVKANVPNAPNNPITVATNASDVTAILDSIRDSLGETSLAVAADGNLWAYNTKHPDKLISHSLIVAHSIDSDEFSLHDVETLNLLADNASALGIQLLITLSNKGCSPEPKAKALSKLVVKTQRVSERGGRLVITLDSKAYPVLFSGENWITERFFEGYAAYGVQESACNAEINTGAEGLSFPIAHSEDGQVAELRVGLDYAHAVLTGTSGSGKSTFLHNVIESACTHYNPRQLVLWLVDYKLSEFGMYRFPEYRYPHIGFVGRDNSSDFIGAFIDLLYETFEKRRSDILDVDARTLVEYNRRVDDVHKLPKMLVIIDEFHHQSDYMLEDEDAKSKFEQLLRESRSFGLYFLISDQVLSGLNGLSQAAKSQLAGRMAMKWGEVSELSDMFGTTGDFMNAQLENGEVIIRNRGELTLYRGRNTQPADIEKSVKGLPQEFFRNAPNFVCYDSSDREVIKLDDPRLAADGFTSDSRAAGSKILLGTVPNFSDPAFTFALRRKRKENVFMYATVLEPIMSVATLMAIGMANKMGSQIVIIAERDNYLFEQCAEGLDLICETCPGALMLDSIESIAEYFQQELSDAFIILIDFNSMAEAMEGLPPVKARGTEPYYESEEDNLRGDLRAMLSGGEDHSGVDAHGSYKNVDQDSDDGLLVDSRGLILDAMKTGGHKNVFFCWIADTIVNPRTTFIDYGTYEDDLDALFPHRFATKCKPIESSDLGMSDRASKIDHDDRGNKVVYSNQRAEIRTIKPYIIKK